MNRIVGAVVASFIGVSLLFFILKKEELSEVLGGELKNEPSVSKAYRVIETENGFLPEDLLYLDEASRDEKQFQLVRSLNEPGQTAQEDVALIKNVFLHYRTAFQENPIGSHEEILRVLIGENEYEVAYIPRSHPAVVGNQLLDRWGTPFYFHQISRDIMEVRSAGPDGIHWNVDDVTVR